MQRRQFLAASLAASAATIAREAAAQRAHVPVREYYQLRRYLLESGPQVSLTEKYLSEALIPALAHRGMGPMGAFRVDIGPETPVLYVLIPSISVEALAGIDLELAHDDEFLKAADPFWSAPANSPGFVRVEASLLASFTGWPKVTPPPAAASHGRRILQLRTYESPSHRDHVRKVEMFHSGEFEIFKAAGFRPVFFGDTLIGPRMPSLTYMLSFSDLTEMDALWDKFRNDPDWKKLSADPRFAYEPIVSNITNLILSPLAASQI
ncbi:MAG TPA: NIPSNAP family protein [Terracidiphilus sp.]|nr:NIPSNAP family protein [Terracidiphilus sp.]